MNITRLLIDLFILYLLYKLVFELIVPVYKTTKQVKSKINEMHERMQQEQANAQYRQPANTVTPKKDPNKDYIEYEEVK